MRGPNRRQVLAAIVLAPVALAAPGALAGCGALGGLGDGGAPDPLVELAAQAHADAALAGALAAAGVAGADTAHEVEAARVAHAAALDAEVARRAGGTGAGPTTAAAPAAAAPTVAALRDALTASGQAAARAALDLPADRVGLVAAVSACCTAHAETLA